MKLPAKVAAAASGILAAALVAGLAARAAAAEDQKPSASASPRKAYYVDPVNGGDTNPGTAAQPWKTMDRAKPGYSGDPRVAPGDTVVLRSGNYGAVSFDQAPEPRPKTWDDKITYAAETGQTPVFTGLTISGPYDRYLEFDGIRVVDETVPRASSSALVSLSGSGRIRFRNMYICGNGGEKVADADWTSGGIVISGNREGDFVQRDVLIEGCEITRVTRPIFASGGSVLSGFVIRNNNIHFAASTAIGLGEGGETHPVDVKEEPVLIEGNHIHNQPVIGTNHGSGLAIRCYPVTVRRNIIHDYGRTSLIGLYWQQFDGGLWLAGTAKGKFVRWEKVTQKATGFTATIHLIQSQRLRLQRFEEKVLFKEGKGEAYNLVGEESGAVLENPTLDPRTIEPYGGYKNMTFENNLIYDPRNVAGVIWLSGVGNNFVFRNNTVVSRWARKESKAEYYRGRYGGGMGLGLARGTDGSTISIYNNIFVGEVGIACTEEQFGDIKEDGNIIWSLLGGGERHPVRKDSITGKRTKVFVLGYSNLAEGVDPEVFETSGAFFVGGAEFDKYTCRHAPDEKNQYGRPHGQNLKDAYKLAPNSPAIGFADPDHCPATDLLGNPRDASPDAGCYEYAPPPKK